RPVAGRKRLRRRPGTLRSRRCTRRRNDLEPRRGRLRSSLGTERSARLHPQEPLVGESARGTGLVVDAPALGSPPIRVITVDPVLLFPLAVAFGLLATWWARAAGASDVRVAIDLAVFWSFSVSAAIALSRPSL